MKIVFRIEQISWTYNNYKWILIYFKIKVYSIIFLSSYWNIHTQKVHSYNTLIIKLVSGATSYYDYIISVKNKPCGFFHRRTAWLACICAGEFYEIVASELGVFGSSDMMHYSECSAAVTRCTREHFLWLISKSHDVFTSFSAWIWYRPFQNRLFVPSPESGLVWDIWQL